MKQFNVGKTSAITAQSHIVEGTKTQEALVWKLLLPILNLKRIQKKIINFERKKKY